MNIFQISQDLLDVFNELEENDGELTDELEKRLTVSQAEFKTKVEGYTKVIKQAESDIELVDKEIKRLQELKKSKNNAIDRLKKVIAWAIETFGETNKSGNKYYDYGTGKITVRTTQKVEVNTDVTDTVVSKLLNNFRRMYFNNSLYVNDEVDLEDTLAIINAPDEDEVTEVNITEEDFKSITAKLSFDINIAELLKGDGFQLIRYIFENGNIIRGKSDISKAALKDALTDENAYNPTYAEIINNKSITIR